MLKEENVKGSSLQEFQKRQYEEALLRMGLLNLDKHCIKAFQNGEVWESEGKGSLYELDENEKQMVKEFEEMRPYNKYFIIDKNKLNDELLKDYVWLD